MQNRAEERLATNEGLRTRAEIVFNASHTASNYRWCGLRSRGTSFFMIGFGRQHTCQSMNSAISLSASNRRRCLSWASAKVASTSERSVCDF
jgi:hypothetical protein